MFNSVICGILLLALPDATATGQGSGPWARERIEWISVSPQGTYVAVYIGQPDAYQSRLLVLDSSAHRVSKTPLTRLERVGEQGGRCAAWAPDGSGLFVASGGSKATEGELLMLSLPAGRIQKRATVKCC